MNKLMPILAALLALLAACSRGFRDDLQRADDLMETAPDSAMALLQAVDTATLAGRDIPYYALLYTQAQVKTDAAPASDSLIAIALESFRHDPAPALRLRAHFYSAKIAFNNCNFAEAMKNVVISYDIAKRLDDAYWVAKSAEMMGDIFTDTYNHPQSAIYTEEAAKYYLKAGKIRNHRYAMCDLATRNINLGNLDRSLTILDSIRSVATHETPVDSGLYNYAIGAMLPAILDLERYDELEKLLNTYNSDSTYEENFSILLVKSYIAANKGDSTGMASSLFEAYQMSDFERERIRALYASYCNAFTLGQYKEAALMSDTLIALQSKIAKQMLYESVSSIQKDYYLTETQNQRQHSRTLKHIIIAVSIASIIIITLVVLLYHQNLRAKRAELEANIAAIMQYKETSAQDKTKIEILLRERWSIFNNLCNEYFEFGQTPKARRRILDKIDIELKRLGNTETLKAIEQSTDSYIGGLISAAHTECTFLNNQDFILLSLILNKYPSRTICVILDIKYKNYYLRKSRLIKKISESSVTIKEELLRRLQSHRNEDMPGD